MQPRKYSNKNFRKELQKKLKITSEVLEEPAVLRGLVRPETTGLRT
jgi:hypothetical protein